MDHSTLKIAYDNDFGSISEDFLVPCLCSCNFYRRTTYSFSSGVLKSWAGSLSRLVNHDIKIEILCDMTQVCETDKQLIDSLKTTVTHEQRMAVIAERQDTILLDALTFDSDSSNFSARKNILDWMLATGRIELQFAWPKQMNSENRQIQPLYHKKMGYFNFNDASSVAFSGSWNETIMGSQGNLEDCSVFSSEKPEDKERWLDVRNKVDRDWNGDNSRFDVLPVSTQSLEIIKHRAKNTPLAFESSLSSRTDNSIGLDENSLRPYQLDVLSAWEKSERKGIVKHATGSGKTFTALFAMKRHLIHGGVCLVVVPSRLLMQQWNVEIPRVIPEVKNRILNVGHGYSQWKRRLPAFSRSTNSPDKKIIVAIANTARSEAFLTKLTAGKHLMVVSDEVHRLGSLQNALILNNLDSGPRLGLSATPERYLDPEGTQRILKYFGAVLDPIYELKDAIGTALVPYEYHPTQCELTEEELSEWAEISSQISRLYATCKVNSSGEPIPSKYLQLKLIERSRIGKQAKNKVLLTCKLLSENYQSGERWLVYCDSTRQMNDIADALSTFDLSSSFYHSQMHDKEKEQALKNFKLTGGILLSIKCLDEGVDIPSITHALIVASDQNPRQFIQRRGRVLRKDSSNAGKDKAYIWDLILTVPNSLPDLNSVKSLCIAELKRSIEFSTYSSNFEISSKKLRDIARRVGIKQEDLERPLEDIEAIEEE